MRKIKQQIVEIPEYYCDNCNDRIYDKNPRHCILCKEYSKRSRIKFLTFIVNTMR